MSDRSMQGSLPEWSHDPENYAPRSDWPGWPPERATPRRALPDFALCEICESKPRANRSFYCSVCDCLYRVLHRTAHQWGAPPILPGEAISIVRRLHVAIDTVFNGRDMYYIGFAKPAHTFNLSYPGNLRLFFAPQNVYLITPDCQREARSTGLRPPPLEDGPDFAIWRRTQRRRRERRTIRRTHRRMRT